jgi:hypothetical protein
LFTDRALSPPNPGTAARQNCLGIASIFSATAGVLAAYNADAGRRAACDL